LIKLQAEIYSNRVEIVYTLADAPRHGDADVTGALTAATHCCLPMLNDAGIPVFVRPEPFSHFAESTRRKGRLIADCRAPQTI
ncbi:MAG: hypothetical protein ACTHJZ_10755, partial [Trinickia sp.]|uniref:hypothetical protein n=1 Tax=Trinickia sp. TaxID=2571163 RepID=UPI003F7CE6B1